MQNSIRSFFPISIFVLLLASCFCSCASCTAQDFDSDYYEGLIAMKNNDTDLAERLLSLCAKNGSYLVARKSLEALCSLQDVQQRIQTAQEMVEKYDDKDAYLFAAKVLYQAKEYQKLINLTDDLTQNRLCPDTIGYRIYALSQKNDSRLGEELFLWNSEAKYTQSHFALYKKLLHTFDEAKDETVLYKFRAAVFIKDYGTAVSRMDEMKYLIDTKKVKLCEYLISDIGKAYLYGSTSFERNARYFEGLFSSYPQDYYTNLIKFHCAFYAARLWKKGGNTQKALEWFKTAIDVAQDKDNFDNALWYYLDAAMTSDISFALKETAKYSSLWKNSEYFDDYFDTLCVKLLHEKLFQQFYELYLEINDKTSDEVTAKLAYISARLIEEKLVTPHTQTPEQASRSAFLRASKCGYDGMYYRLMAAKKLKLKDKDFLYMANMPTSSQKKAMAADFEEEKLLKGYITHGLHEFVFGEWQKQKEHISLNTAIMASTYLLNAGSTNSAYFSQSLRIISYSCHQAKQEQQEKIMHLLFPQNFLPYIQKSCALHGVNEYLLFSLIRTESFFNPQAKSSAGAVGLTQLMPSTAKEVANRLKIKDYELFDAQTSIDFGCFYFKDMLNRLPSSGLLASFAYNAGITNVRTWVKTAAKEQSSQLPYDLFLEILPYKETRDYGRKIIAAACMYASLYYGKTTSSVIDEML